MTLINDETLQLSIFPNLSTSPQIVFVIIFNDTLSTKIKCFFGLEIILDKRVFLEKLLKTCIIFLMKEKRQKSGQQNETNKTKVTSVTGIFFFIFLVQQQRHNIAMFGHNVKPRWSHFVCLYGKSSFAKVPQQNATDQHTKVDGELTRMSTLLHEIRSRWRHVQPSDMQAHCLPNLPRKLPDNRDHWVTHRHRVSTLLGTDASVRHSAAAQNTSKCDIEIRRLYGAARASRRSWLSLVSCARL